MTPRSAAEIKAARIIDTLVAVVLLVCTFLTETQYWGIKLLVGVCAGFYAARAIWPERIQ